MEVFTVTLVGAISNVVLASLKIGLGIGAGSRALVADGVHSLSDLMTDAAVFLGLRAASRPADDNHAFGHGRFETVSALFVGVMLTVAGVGIGIDATQSIIGSLHGSSLPQPNMVAAVVALVSIFVKEALYRVTIRTGKRIGSPAIAANAWHHRSDALSSIAAFLGITGAAVLGPTWSILDPIAAVVVAALVVGVGGHTVISSLREMTDVGLPREECREILTAVGSVPGVSDPHNLKTRRLGTTVAVEVHFRVKGSITVDEGHKIATDVETRIKARFGDATRVITHVEPIR